MEIKKSNFLIVVIFASFLLSAVAGELRYQSFDLLLITSCTSAYFLCLLFIAYSSSFIFSCAPEEQWK
jgi:hypothetical protein